MKYLNVSLPAFLMLLFYTSSYSQTSFRFIENPSTLEGEITEVKGEKYEIAKEIYDNLVEAIGDKRYPAPPFRLSNSEQWGAFLEGDGNSIGLEEKAYDVLMNNCCVNGKSAIALILGHELIHYYQKHQWQSGFVEAFRELQVGRDLSKLVEPEKLKNETQSDYLGGFLAYSAGYAVYDVLPDVYDMFYKGYDLPETIKGYPDLKERKLLASAAKRKMLDLIDVFEVANILTALGRIKDARVYYKHILLDFQSKEIFNNLGVLTVLEALDYYPQSDSIYRIPLELDFSLSAGTRDVNEDKEKIRNALLNEALGYFNSAITLDPDYAAAYLNKACVFYLKDDEVRARFFAATEAIQLAKATEAIKTQTDSEVLLALIEEKFGDKSKAITLLEDLKDKSAAAQYNLLVMKGETPPKPSESDGPEFEEIDGIAFDGIRNYTRQPENRTKANVQELYGTLKLKSWKDSVALKNSRLYICEPEASLNPDPKVYLLITGKNYKEETLNGFKVGTTRQEIIDEYGEPRSTQELVDGEIMVYEELIFILDELQLVSRWALYQVKS